MSSLFRKNKSSQGAGTTFSYKPLAAGEVRLLRLLPSNSSSAAPSGSLITACLIDPKDGQIPSYEALSYVWGSEPAESFIQLDKSRFEIKPNLDAALRILNKGKTERLLWIDSICINQTDLDERNQQVRLMKAIYQKAQRVVIWIGVTAKGSAAEIIARFADLQRRGKGHHWLTQHLDNPKNKTETERHIGLFSDYTEVKHVDPSGGHWPSLVEFFEKSWFRRVWVRQELVVSSNAIVLCGSTSVAWTDVAAVCHWLKIWAPDLDNKTKKYGGRHRSGVYAGEDLEYFRQISKTNGNLDFESMVIHARSCEATESRDRIFAILGLVGNETKDVVVDYSLHVSQVAVQAFKKLVSKNNRLESLIFSQNANREQDIPSWAPNICSPFSAQPSRLKGQATSIYDASKGKSEEFYFLADGITLNVKGVVFDTIEKVSRPASGESVSAWRPLLFSWLGTMDMDQKYERLMRTLTYDRDIRGRRMTSRADGLDWTRYFRVEHLGVGTRTEFEYLSAAIHGSRFEGSGTDQAEVDAWLRLCGEVVNNRRMVLTPSGRAGLVPTEAEPWDVVCIIWGLDVPFVLRKVAIDTYILIGEAFIYDAMDGEILSDSNFEAHNILLQ